MKQYLGDSVYADWDGYHVVLTTENGLPNDPSNTICLDSQVLLALANFVEATTVGEKNGSGTVLQD